MKEHNELRVGKRLGPYFDASPNLHFKIVNRITGDNKVMDHEHITGARGSEEPFDIVVIYKVNDGLITNMVAVRKNKWAKRKSSIGLSCSVTKRT